MNRKFTISACAGLMAGSVLLTGCGSMNPSATMIKINTGDSTDTITTGYVNFVAQYQTAVYDSVFMSYYGESYMNEDMSGSGSTMGQTMVSNLLDDLEEQYLCKLHAADYDISLSDDDNQAIADAVSQFESDNDEETLDAMGYSADYLTAFLEYRTYLSRVEQAVKDAADVEVTEDEAWQRTFSYVLFSTAATTDDDGNSVELTDDEVAELKSQADQLAAATSSDEYDTVAESLGTTVSTYSYTKGEEEDSSFDMSVIEAANDLSDGEISSVIEVEGTGYYVLRLDADHDEEASATKMESLTSDKEDEAYDTVLEGWKDEITWKVNEKQQDKIVFDKHYTAPAEEETTEESTDTSETTEESTDTTDATEEDVETTEATEEEAAE